MADEKKSGVHGTALSGVVKFLEKERDTAREAMKTGDTAAARKAISAENDIAAVKRVSERFSKGFYA